MSVDISQYKVGVVLSLEDCGKCKGGGKSLRACKIRVGGVDDNNFDDENDVVTVVTSAPNVRLKSRSVHVAFDLVSTNALLQSFAHTLNLCLFAELLWH